MPAYGIRTVDAPIDESKRSTSPFCEQTSSLERFALRASAFVIFSSADGTCVLYSSSPIASISTAAC